jgi:hypothetical protein
MVPAPNFLLVLLRRKSSTSFIHSHVRSKNPMLHGTSAADQSSAKLGMQAGMQAL